MQMSSHREFRSDLFGKVWDPLPWYSIFCKSLGYNACRWFQWHRGVLGGISSGQDIIARIALKPTSSLVTPGRSVDKAGNEVEVVTKGRHDPCVGIRATPIAEAMIALVLMDHVMRHRAQNPERGP